MSVIPDTLISVAEVIALYKPTIESLKKLKNDITKAKKDFDKKQKETFKKRVLDATEEQITLLDNKIDGALKIQGHILDVLLSFAKEFETIQKKAKEIDLIIIEEIEKIKKHLDK